MQYNNPHFTVKLYDWDLFNGPRAGEPAPDFTVTDMAGNEVSLSDYRGKWVVVETASATCSMYCRNIEPVRVLRHDFPDIEFLVVYVREAHPGERRPQHKDMADKMAAAKLLADKLGEHRPVLVDSHDGGMHQAYGAMPNIVYVISPEGMVHYRCDWTIVEELREVLSNRDRIHTNEHADMDRFNNRDVSHLFRTLVIGGFVAAWDFLIAVPALFKRHRELDAYYKKHGQLRRPGEPKPEA